MADYLNPEDVAMQSQIARQQKMADLLWQQGAQSPQGQIVSGQYVKPSPLQYLSNMANQYVGNKTSEAATQAQVDLATKLRGKQEEAVQNYMNAMQSTPAQEGGIQGPNGMTTQTTPDMYNADMSLNPQYKQVAPVAAQGPDYYKAFKAATSPYAPAPLQSAGYEMLKPQKLGEGETLNRFNFANGQLTPYASGGEKLPTEYKEYQKAISDPNQPYKGSFFQYQQERSRATANQNTINMPPVESAYNAAFGKGVAEQDLALKNIAEGAKTTVANIGRQKQILDSGKFFSGKAANIQNELANFGTALGVTGKDGQEKAANTQSLIGGSAGITLDNIKGSGLGAGQGFTDKDLQFLQDAKSFKITWNKENIARVLDLQERAAIEGAKKWNNRYGQIQKTATGPINVQGVDVPKPYSGQVKYLGNE
jgi:hypothetical protein